MNSTPRYIERPNAAAVAMHALMLPNRPSHGFDRTVSPIMHVIMLWMEKQIVSNAFDRSGRGQRTWKAPSKRKLNWSKEWRFWCFSRAHDRVCVTRISRSICAWSSHFLRNSRLCPGTDLPKRRLCEEKTNRLREFGGVDLIDVGRLLGILPLRVGCHEINQMQRWHAYDRWSVVGDFRAPEEDWKGVSCNCGERKRLSRVNCDGSLSAHRPS